MGAKPVSQPSQEGSTAFAYNSPMTNCSFHGNIHVGNKVYACSPSPTLEAQRLGEAMVNTPDKVYGVWGAGLPPKNEDFVGRERLLGELYATFFPGSSQDEPMASSSLYTRALTPLMQSTQKALRGVDKTQLAAYYVHQCRVRQQAQQYPEIPRARLTVDIEAPLYHGILWLNAANEQTLRDSFLSVARAIGIVFTSEEAARHGVYPPKGIPPVSALTSGVIDTG